MPARLPDAFSRIMDQRAPGHDLCRLDLSPKPLETQPQPSISPARARPPGGSQPSWHLRSQAVCLVVNDAACFQVQAPVLICRLGGLVDCLSLHELARPDSGAPAKPAPPSSPGHSPPHEFIVLWSSPSSELSDIFDSEGLARRRSKHWTGGCLGSQGFRGWGESGVFRRIAYN